MKERLEREKGITLIALVITIIVLLILAGVSIAMLTGENGILTQAQRAKKETTEAQEKEKIQLAVSSSKLENVNNSMKISYEKLNEGLKQEFNDDFTLKDNNDYTFLITINTSQRTYYVSEEGDVIDDNSILKITTAEELKKFRDDVNSGNNYDNKVVILMDNITLDEEWMPIGYIDDENIVKFNGDFNGLNHKINNLNINNPQKLYQGLFANTGSSAQISSVVVTGNVTGGKYVGTIVGYNEGTIKNCGNEASVICQYDVEGEWNLYCGGIAGYNYNGKISGCYNKGEVNSTKYSAGGIVGKSENGIIENSYNLSIVIAKKGEAGGICGAVGNSDIFNVYNNGEIKTLEASGCGGVIGVAINEINIINAYNISKIEGDGNTGGIVGYFEKGKVEYCYSKSSIICNETAGGIIGTFENVESIVSKCYFLGSVEAFMLYNGPIIGKIEKEIITQNCEWYTENQEYYNSMLGNTSIKFNENIDMKSVIEVVNGDNFFVSNGDDNNPKLYWE